MESGDARVVDTGGATLACQVYGSGPLVVMAHGFPDCPRSFRHQVPALVTAGYRVAVPALRGYAPSSPARDGRYDAAALGADLVAVAREVGGGQPAILVGHDWGAIAAYAACALAPGAFTQLVTIAVPHLRTFGPGALFNLAQLRRSWYIGLFQLPFLAERRLAADDFALVDRLWRDWSPGWQAPADELRAVKAAMRNRVPEVLAFYRALKHPAYPRHLLMQRTRVPALYVHGRADGCMGVELTDGCERGYAGPITVHRLAGGHFVHQENGEEFNRVLLGFLQQRLAA
jgi:pimeloyl-ACP methyl ester carboxylesterase